MSGRKTIFGTCNKKLEKWHWMRLFQKVKSVFRQCNGRSEQSRATYDKFDHKFEDYSSSSSHKKYETFFQDLKLLSFFFVY